MNLGLRWDPWLPYKEIEGRVVCFAPGLKSSRFPNAPEGLIYGGGNPDNGCPESGAPRRLTPFAPRFGFALRLTRDGKTSLRGGAGIFYVPIQSNTYNVYADMAPFAPTFDLTDVSFTDPFGSAGLPNPFPAQYGPNLPGKDVPVHPARRPSRRLQQGFYGAGALQLESLARAAVRRELGRPRGCNRQ